jgi:drug/metabolite transporter (DMT)-like permease
VGAEVTAVVFGLTAAVAWGAADFGGGLLTKRAPALGVVLVSQVFGLGAALVAAFLRGEPVPPPADLAWATAAAWCGGLGMVALYHGLATGRMGIVAPTTGVVMAALPVAVGMVLAGLPGPVRLAGFFLGFAALVLVSAGAARGDGPTGLRPALAAGCGFGLFSVLFSRVSAGLVFGPIAAARAASILLLSVIVVAGRGPWRPPRRLLPGLFAIGLVDITGNMGFLLAAQAGRLDVAALLSSLYPVVTVVLAAVVLRERVTVPHAIGIGTAAVAVGLIAVG